MATRMAEKERFLVGAPSAPTRTAAAPDGFSRHASRGLWAGASILLLGSFIDLGVLWVLQYQPTPQWEFVATMNTLEAYTRFSIGIGLIYAALFIGRSASMWKYRLTAVFMLLLGIVGMVLGLVLLNDYFALSRLTQDQTAGMGALVISVTKGVLLSGLITVLFVPLGILGLRRPRFG
jgi:hypothetical protein